MRSPIEKVCLLAVALAVLLVSVTCSSAGCLLQSELPAGAGHQRHSCCEGYGTGTIAVHHKTPADGDGRCPMCHTSVLIGKSVEKSAKINLNPLAQFQPFLAGLDSLCSIPTELNPCGAMGSMALPSWQTPTLLSLHCALQN